MSFKTGGLDRKSQIGLETYTFCAIPCECNNFLTVMNFTFKLKLCIGHLKILHYFRNYFRQGQIDIQTCKIFVLKL